ncbi:MAG: hypothetical protein HZB86_02540 [Deltaproteobacteria bacterium]|nr:hypothetical protein [Deltaproteobacteria bacterium]
MADFPINAEVIALFTKIFKGTLKGVIQWEKTADTSMLVAPLEGEYGLSLKEIPDLDERDAPPDHALSLSKGRQIIFILNRKDFEGIDFQRLLGEKYEHVYTVFRELWINAYLKAHKITEEINIISSILDKKLK